jgi:hypothetical protein
VASSTDPLEQLLRQGLTHKDVLIREWARRLLLSHGDRHEQRGKTPRRRPVPPAAKT